jgi:hypothetical protein
MRCMPKRFVTLLTGRGVPKIRQAPEREPSIINEKTIADFSRVVVQTGILAPGAPSLLQGPGPDGH